MRKNEANLLYIYKKGLKIRIITQGFDEIGKTKNVLKCPNQKKKGREREPKKKGRKE
jgi:hypothetical protein